MSWGEDRSERLDVMPARFKVIVTRRPKYACRACQDAVVQAPAPARLIEAGIPTELLVAHVLVGKYAGHCPLYRQAQIYARQGVDLDRSTKAIRYAFHHWDGLILFANDGRIEMDTNTVERSIRPLALNRKNALFAGHDHGADHWATVASLIETCKLNGVDPQAYLASVLSRLVNGWPMRRIDELMPWAYATRQSDTAAA